MLEKIRRDKWRHFFVGLAMGAVFEFLLLRLLPAYLVIGSAIVLILIVVISYGFELISLITKKGHYDVLDAFAGVLGGLIGTLIILLIK